MALSLDDFASKLDELVKYQVETVARVRDEFQQRANALITEAVGDGTDITEEHSALFELKMTRMQKLIDEV